MFIINYYFLYFTTMFIPKFNNQFLTQWTRILNVHLDFLSENNNGTIENYLTVLYSIAGKNYLPAKLEFFSELQKIGPIEQTLFYAMIDLEHIEQEKYDSALDVLAFLVIDKKLDATTEDLVNLNKKSSISLQNVNINLIRLINLFSSIEHSEENKKVVLNYVQKRYNQIDKSKASNFNFISLDLQNSINTYFGDYLSDEQYLTFCPDLDCTNGIDVGNGYSSRIKLNINKTINHYKLNSDDFSNIRINILAFFKLLESLSNPDNLENIKKYVLPDRAYEYSDTIISEPRLEKTFTFSTLEEKHTFDIIINDFLTVFIPDHCTTVINKDQLKSLMLSTLSFVHFDRMIDNKTDIKKKLKI